MNEIQAIEAITKDILAGYYGTRQLAGTETQKWQYAHKFERWLIGPKIGDENVSGF